MKVTLKISPYIPIVFPYLLGPLVHGTLLSQSYDVVYVTGFIIFAVFSIIWFGLRRMALEWRALTHAEAASRPSTSIRSKRPTILFITIVVCGLLSLALLESIRLRLPRSIFHITVALMALTSLSDGLAIRNSYRIFILSRFVTISLLCICTMNLGLSSGIVWQSLPFALAVGSFITAHELGQLLYSQLPMNSQVESKTKKKGKAQDTKASGLFKDGSSWPATTYRILLLAGPAILLSLTYLQFLPLQFLVTALLVPIAAPLVLRTRDPIVLDSLKYEAFHRDNTSFCILFAVIITMLIIL